MIYTIPAIAAILLTVGLIVKAIQNRRAYNGALIVTREGITTPAQPKQYPDLQELAKDVKPSSDYGWEWHQ